MHERGGNGGDERGQQHRPTELARQPGREQGCDGQDPGTDEAEQHEGGTECLHTTQVAQRQHQA